MDINSISSASSEQPSNYSLDENNLRTGIGELKWHNDTQHYKGRLYKDCVHGRGRYTWIKKDRTLFYEGWFYANDIEGYGKFYYDDMSVFEGLFKKNVRFGPGVFTHSNGSQDVGLWYGQDLIRLCNTVKTEFVPNLAKGSLAKIKLMRHKRLVSICDKTTDKAREILKLLESNCEVLKESNKLYNVYVRNPQSNFFNKMSYDERYFCQKDCYIEVPLTQSEEFAYQEKFKLKECDSQGVEEEEQVAEDEGEEEELITDACFSSWCDFECVCENPKQIRANSIKLELERAKTLLRRLEWEVKVARQKRKNAIKRKKLHRLQFFAHIESLLDATLEAKESTITFDGKFYEKLLRMCDGQFNEEKEYFEMKGKRLWDQTLELDKLAQQRPMCADKEITELAVRESDLLLTVSNEKRLLNDDYWYGDLLDEDVSDSSDVSDEEEELVVDDDEIVDYTTICKLYDSARMSFKQMQKRVDLLSEKLRKEVEKPDELEAMRAPTKRVLITDLLAWNNGELSIELMKHTFLHRNYENNVSHSIADILIGNRSSFSSFGTKESDCISFLIECSDGDVRKVFDLLYKSHINPDVCDGRGNTGIMFAAARNKVKVIAQLVNVGANVDFFNDECLTPLNLCVAKYFATQNHIVDWESAFIKPTEIQQAVPTQWRPHSSLTSLNNVNKLDLSGHISDQDFIDGSLTQSQYRKAASLKFGSSELFGSNFEVLPESHYAGSIIETAQRLQKLKFAMLSQTSFKHNEMRVDQKYALDLECVVPLPEKKTKDEKKKVDTKKGKSNESSKKSKKSTSTAKTVEVAEKEKEVKEEVVFETEPVDLILGHRLDTIYETILLLLKSGADPNLCEVPLQTIILATYTLNKNLVERLLEKKANPNVATLDELLNPLHIIAAHPPSEAMLGMLEVLLKYSTNPNARASPFHWPAEKEKLIGAKYVLQGEDEGKTPLHLLCMRYDFNADSKNILHEMALLLIKNGAKSKDLYLGHTPLSISMLRGNIGLIESLLKPQRINPNRNLGENMGVPLTLYILKRYADVLPPIELCRDIIDLLIKYKANPFDLVENFGNAIDFMILEHEIGDTTDKKGGNKKGDSKKGSSKKGDSKKGNKVNVQDEVKAHLLESSRTVLERHLKGWTAKYLYLFVEDENYYDDVSALMAKVLTVEECIQLIQLLIHKGEIELTETTHDTLYDLIEFLINVNNKPVGDGKLPSSRVNIEQLIESFEYVRKPNEKGQLNLHDPETEKHGDKYEVCYECLKSKNCQLFICPDCKLIYFCSKECNAKNMKNKKSIHVCKNNFYKRQFDIYQEKVKREGLQGEGQLQKLQTNMKRSLEQDTFGDVTRKIPPDETKRLHLTRPSKQRRSRGTDCPHFFSGSDVDLHLLLSERFGLAKGSHLYEEIMKKELDGIYKSDAIGIDDRKLIGGKGKGGKMRIKDEAKLDKNGKLMVEKSKRVGNDGKGAKNEIEKRNEKFKRRDKKGGPFEEGGRRTVKIAEGSSYLKSEEGGGKKLKGEEKYHKKGGVTSRQEKDEGGREKRRRSSNQNEGGRKSSTNVPFSGPSEKDELLLFLSNFDQVGGPLEMEMGETMKNEQLVDLKRRLPSKYQRFLEKIAQYWPDLDLSMLFLPYACYKGGQLYYRFLTQKPLFMETYSNL